MLVQKGDHVTVRRSCVVGHGLEKKDDLKIIEAVVVGVYSRYVSLKTCETNVPFTIAVGDLPRVVLENRTRALATASSISIEEF